jgi:protein-S-isoprenylcysteine O-methyltransferase Ste14
MPDPDSSFRWLALAGFVAVLLVAAPHRVRSWQSREPLDRRQEGAFILATLRPIGAALWLGLILYLIRPSAMAWSAMPLPGWSRWSGVVLLAIALLFLEWTLRSLGLNLTDTVVTRREATLVTHGPYRYVRHPFYDAMALLVVAFALIAANWFFLLSGGLVFALLAIRSAREEERLLARFGDAYRTYVQQTGRFLPRLPGRPR